MANAPKLLEKMRQNKAGHRRRDVLAVLEYYGYMYDREARHGSLYYHPELVAHPELHIRMGPARVVIPKGREMPEYVPRDVETSVDTLIAWREERE